MYFDEGQGTAIFHLPFYMGFGSTRLLRKNAYLCLQTAINPPILWFTPLHMLKMWILTMSNSPVDAILLQE